MGGPMGGQAGAGSVPARIMRMHPSRGLAWVRMRSRKPQGNCNGQKHAACACSSPHAQI